MVQRLRVCTLLPKDCNSVYNILVSQFTDISPHSCSRTFNTWIPQASVFIYIHCHTAELKIITLNYVLKVTDIQDSLAIFYIHYPAFPSLFLCASEDLACAMPIISASPCLMWFRILNDSLNSCIALTSLHHGKFTA